MASIFADHLLHKKHVVPASGGYTKMRFAVDEEVFEEEQRLDVRSCDERLAAVVVVILMEMDQIQTKQNHLEEEDGVQC